MAKEYSINFQDNIIKVINSPVECKLVINEEVADIYWGIFALSVKLFGEIEINNIKIPVKAVISAKYFRIQCAIFAGNKLIFSTTPISST